MKRIAIALLACLPVFGVGSVGQSINPLGPQAGTGGLPESRVHVMTITWVGDSITGTVPSTVISTAAFPQMQGMRLFQIKVQPGTPNPTANYSVTLTDETGVDLLQGQGANLSATASFFNGSLLSPPLLTSPTFNLSGNSVASARGTVTLYFAPLSTVAAARGLPATLPANNTLTGTNLAPNLNSILYVGGNEPQVGGSADIGAQINAAYALLPSNGGTIDLLAQTGGSCYNFSTPIVFATLGKYVVLQGIAPTSLSSGATPSGGACLNYTPTTATFAVTLDYSPATGGAYIPGGGMRDLVLTNNACVTNGGCGSSATGVKTGTTNGGAHKAEFSNVRVSGFGTGIALNDTGGIGWGIVFRNFSLTWNTTGFVFGTFHENIAWYGGVCAVNTTCLSDSTSSNVNAHGISVDANVTVGITGNPNFSCTGCYSENLNQANFQLATVTGGVSTWVALEIVNDNNSGTLTQFITSTAGYVNFDAAIFSAGQTVTNILNNSGGGTGDINWSSSSPTLVASACATPVSCFSRQRSVSGQPPRLSTPSVAIPADTIGVGGIANTTACRHNAANNWLECSYNNDAFGKIGKVNQTNTWSATQTLASPVITGTVPTYNGSNTAGQGLVPVSCVTSQRTESAADANLLTCAIPASAGNYRLRFSMDVSAANAATFGWTATWTDSNGTSQAPTNLPIIQAGINTWGSTLTSGQGNYYGYADISVNNAGTSIVVKLTFSGTSFTGKASATVERIV